MALPKDFTVLAGVQVYFLSVFAGICRCQEINLHPNCFAPTRVEKGLWRLAAEYEFETCWKQSGHWIKMVCKAQSSFEMSCDTSTHEELNLGDYSFKNHWNKHHLDPFTNATI